MAYVHMCNDDDLRMFGPDLTCAEFAKATGCTRMGVYVAIKQGKIKASMPHKRWMVPASELVDYPLRKYNRHYSKYKGEPLFDKILLLLVALVLGCPMLA